MADVIPKFNRVDDFSSIAYSTTGSAQRRLRLLQDIYDEVAPLADPAPEQDKPETIANNWRVEAWMACLPSFSQLAVRRTHDAEVAEQVILGLRPLAAKVLERQAADYARPLGTPRSGNAEGFAAELSVLGLLWWGAANRPGLQTSYAHPATTKQRQSTGHTRHTRDGFDVLARTPEKTTEALQVKRVVKPHVFKTGGLMQWPVAKAHANKVTVVSPGQLVEGNPDYAHILLLDALVTDNKKALTKASAALIRKCLLGAE